jgi:glycosyltransferase involved in cell wall biosynthesis
MRVVLVSEVLGVGGLPNYVLDLARVMSEAGMSVLVAHGNAPLPSHLEAAGIGLLHLPGLAAAASEADADHAIVALRSWHPDVVHVHLLSTPAMIGRLLTSGLVLVRTFHDLTSVCLRRGRRRWPGDRCQRALGWACVGWGCLLAPAEPGGRLPRVSSLPAKLAERDGYRAFAANIAISNFIARTLRLNGFPQPQIHVVPNFSIFDDAALAAAAPVRLPGVPGHDRPFELLFVGQAVAGKGLEILIAALISLSGNWRLTVLAEGPRLGPARAMAEQGGVSSRIRFLGWVGQSETREHYRAADLVVVPSVFDEPSGLVGIEAMSLGKPLVGFAVGGIPDYLLDQKTGLLVREITSDALRAALAEAISDPARLAGWGEAARAFSAQTHTRARHLQAIRRVYEIARGGVTQNVPIKQVMEADPA